MGDKWIKKLFEAVKPRSNSDDSQDSPRSELADERPSLTGLIEERRTLIRPQKKRKKKKSKKA